ncbi:mechanosensitive ion channel [Chitinibacter bivalviorum]|uniref:Small-conductance mechanosensitive channel n=1 Tax=Chitinibacter bivalviorum TaxID=2739434 RepID=A0A7H9BJK5_9NEIS|nr:mechanosensitive ion channel family protein [Chitinibacter bivalviorum]QLG88857.1 mechanosensitive ion channel [Chitinibacter bivalviorum]
MKHRLLHLCTMMMFLAFIGLSWANDAPAPTEANEGYVAKINNRDIMTFHSPILTYSAQDRALGAEQRIKKILASLKEGKVDSSMINAPAIGISITIDGQQAFIVLQDDVNTLSGETLESTANKAKHQLRMLIAESNELRDPKQLLHAAAYALVATAIFAALIYALSKSRIFLFKAGRRYITRPVAHLAQKTTGVSFSLLNRVLRWLINSITTVFGLIFLYSWTSLVFSLFPFTRAWSERLNDSILTFLGNVGEGILHAIPSFLVIVFIVVCARYSSRFLHFVFGRIERGEMHLSWFDRETASTTRKIMSFLVWLLAIAMIYPYLPGADTEAFKGLSVMVGLMVSLGASSVVGQFASGLILIYAKSLKQGEYVQIGDTEGTVMHIGLFATKIHTNLREEISIPNSVLVGQSVKNFSRLAAGGGVITQVGVTIGYDTPWRQVEAMLIEAADQTSGVRQIPSPIVYQTALSDYYVEYFLRIAVDEPRRRLEIMSELHAKIQDVFNTYGVQIMSPHYRGDPPDAKIIAPENWAPAPAKGVDAPYTS